MIDQHRGTICGCAMTRCLAGGIYRSSLLWRGRARFWARLRHPNLNLSEDGILTFSKPAQSCDVMTLGLVDMGHASFATTHARIAEIDRFSVAEIESGAAEKRRVAAISDEANLQGSSA